MLKNQYKAILSLLLIVTFNVSSFAKNQCVAVGGMGLAEAIDETHLVASLSGTMAGARAKILAQTTTETGLILDMEHYFISDENGLLKTRDKATLTTVPGKEQTYMIEIEYKVVESKGIYEGYAGNFHSYGLIKLAKGQVILRYKGEICK